VQALRGQTDDGGLDPEGLALCLLWGSIPPPRTLHRSIHSLPPGCFARVSQGGLVGPTVYWRLGDAQDTARAHLVSDVPVGAFLSGGVDSSALLGLLSAEQARLRTVTLSFDVADLDESELARSAAELYGSDHHEIPIRVDEIRERLPDAIRALDQPSMDGVNTYFVAEAAVRAGLKVAVSGIGGDEIFGGYLTFPRVPRIRRLRSALGALPAGDALAGSLASVVDALPRNRQSYRVSNGLRFGTDTAGAYFAERALFSPAAVRSLLVPELADAIPDPAAELRDRVDATSASEAERISAIELRQYLLCQLLRDTDAVSMRHSLEVRTPLVDRELLERVCRIPPELRFAGPAKRRLREAPRPPVPEALWNRRKQGFVLPFDEWLRSGGIGLRLPKHACFRRDTLESLESDFRAGRVQATRMWMLHVLAAYLD